VLITLTLLVLVAALLPLDPIRDAIDGSVVTDARLERSFGYTVLGPLSSVLDAMTLFTVGQIIAFTLWAMGLYAAARFVQRRHRAVSVAREASYAVAALIVLLVVYAAAAVLPRPMARLIITRSDVIAIDFHAHTHYSHDGRPGWSAADVRDWHAAAGFNAVYITDHATFDGMNEGLLLDTTVAGQGTLLFPGLEAFYHGEHINILNAGFRYKGLTTADLRDVDDQALGLASRLPGLEPVLIETIPGDLSKIIPAHGPGTAGVRAIEIVDGSPRGMSQTRLSHDLIVHVADSLNLALVAGSDNHGWGRTAPGWTLMRLQDWRGYAPDGLERDIEIVLRLAGRAGTHVVERRTAPATPIAVAATLPAVMWTVMRTLSSGERVAWVVWFWVAWVIVSLIRSRSTP
jgi:hypothetical protein